MPDGPPEGWVVDSGFVEPGPKVAAYAARRQGVKGRCTARGCNRRLDLDPRNLCMIGLGALTMRQVQQTFRCHRVDGCGLEFHDEPPGLALRLGQFVGLPHVRVWVTCRGAGCKFFRHWRVEEMVSGLVARKEGDDRTEVQALAPMMTSACPLCREVNWAVAVQWINTGTMGWRELGEKTFGPPAE